MFESTVVESRKQKVGIQRILTLPVSVAIHVVVVVAVVVGAIWNVEFPTNSPAQVAQYSVASAPPPPPPPPPPPQPAAPPPASAAQSGDGNAGDQAGRSPQEHPGDGSHHGA